MKTIFDWLAVLLFCAIALTYLHRSLAPRSLRSDHMLAYLPPVLGCVAANWLGNDGAAIAAYALLFASAAYYVMVLKPQQDFT
ncbi:XrtV sorting system accessory protein [Qipengyuania spongiae]|uniref:Uncharacterized protein n=1 Tax=Qipengyuania spongiae TaxID=2909673 RepID=A0ABY5SX03_9SPHN|nr:XrtV sorting system accessory protein [Qipengyuania spongiae]UVI39072.1 hypothetical protein L1F33_12670 [Qipengyuania spongiae]